MLANILSIFTLATAATAVTGTPHTYILQAYTIIQFY